MGWVWRVTGLGEGPLCARIERVGVSQEGQRAGPTDPTTRCISVLKGCRVYGRDRCHCPIVVSPAVCVCVAVGVCQWTGCLP